MTLHAIQDFLAAAAWSVDDFQRAMNGPVRLLRFRGVKPENSDTQGEGWSGNMVLWDPAFQQGGELTKFVVVHELGHVWDHTYDERISAGFWADTRGPHGEDLEPGREPSGQPGNDPRENWAESLAATVYPGFRDVVNPNFGGIREREVRDMFRAFAAAPDCGEGS